MRHEARRLPVSVETGRQLRRFLVVGVLCVVVDLSAYAALALGASLPTPWAKGLSYLIGVGVGFVLNKRWTFESPRKSLFEPATYLLLYSMTLVVNVVCNDLVLRLFESAPTAYLVATGVTTVLNFVGMRLVTFRTGIAEQHLARERASQSTSLRKVA